MVECSYDGCKNQEQAAGLCHKHYYRKRNGGTERAENLSPVQQCAVSHCGRQAHSRSALLCMAHYNVEKIQQRDPELVVLEDNKGTCWVEECQREVSYKSLCKTHAARAREGKIDVPPRLGIKINPPCRFDECDRTSVTRGLCTGHYSQSKKGIELRPLKAYGIYPKGDMVCRIASCDKAAKEGQMCRRHRSIKNKYKLTDEMVEDLSSRVVCDNPGCDSTWPLHIDHDHRTGRVRGVLCVGCNTAFGSLKEDTNRMEGLIIYKKMQDEQEVRVFELKEDK